MQKFLENNALDKKTTLKSLVFQHYCVIIKNNVVKKEKKKNK